MSQDTKPAKYAFLSEAWVSHARAIRQGLRADAPATPMAAVKMNQIVTDVPFGTGTIESHLDTSQGEMDLELGHLEDAEVTLTLDYDTAKAILVEGNPQIAMNAFMSGKIRVTGDVTRLMALQTWAAAPDPTSVAIAKAIRAITE
ncbi:MAG: SCP2 sterol-binding domain-containing protein [Acidimicrobiales bacterium]